MKRNILDAIVIIGTCTAFWNVAAQHGAGPARLNGAPPIRIGGVGSDIPNHPGGGPGIALPPPRHYNSWGNMWGFGHGLGPNSLMRPARAAHPPVAPPIPDTQSGRIGVVGCGYDDMGVWRTVPMTVDYNYNGAQYDATVVSAWDPWTDVWNYDIYVAAINTSYFINSVNYNFYVVLSTGTYYFNL